MKSMGFQPAHRGTKWYPPRIAAEQKAEAERLGVPVAIEHEETGVVMVLVPGGECMMGASPDEPAGSDEKPQHLVSLDPFYVATTPVTQEQWQRVMDQNPSRFKGGDRPVESVSWDAAQEFLRNAAGGGLRLPTEAEWERAARAGSETRYWWGNEYIKGMAKCCDVPIWALGPLRGTSEVGRFEASPWGLWDILGNVWEWCADWYGDDYYKVSTGKNPKGPGSGEHRVFRGGSFVEGAFLLQVSTRGWSWPDEMWTNPNVGFRCARDVP